MQAHMSTMSIHTHVHVQRHTQPRAQPMHTAQGDGIPGPSRTIQTPATEEVNVLECTQVDCFQVCCINHMAHQGFEDRSRLGEEQSREARVVYSNLF